jgi:hypothetical protein
MALLLPTQELLGSPLSGYYFFLVVLGVELRALHLLGRCSTVLMWLELPSFYALVFWIGLHIFLPRLALDHYLPTSAS